jgi:3-deoxy-D-manno-octulosonic-acid transferase
MCDFCFVGGTIADYGGHNIFEPVYFSKPVCFGPHMQNFKDTERIVLEKEAGIKVQDADDLKRMLIQMATSPNLRQRLSTNCRNVFPDGKSSLEKSLDVVSAHMKI